MPHEETRQQHKVEQTLFLLPYSPPWNSFCELKSGHEPVRVAREVGKYDLWSELHSFCQESGVGSVGFDCCGVCAQPWKLEFGAGSYGRGKQMFEQIEMTSREIDGNGSSITVVGEKW
jgi:hypothetical protein